MKNNELFDGIDHRQSFTEKYFGLSSNKFFLLLMLVIGLGIYIGILLYGTNSLSVLLKLQDYESYLQDEIVKLKHDNAELQREYFELKEISAQE